MSQLQFRKENQNFISNFLFQFIKKMKWHFGYTDSRASSNRAFHSDFALDKY